MHVVVPQIFNLRFVERTRLNVFRQVPESQSFLRQKGRENQLSCFVESNLTLARAFENVLRLRSSYGVRKAKPSRSQKSKGFPESP